MKINYNAATVSFSFTHTLVTKQHEFLRQRIWVFFNNEITAHEWAERASSRRDTATDSTVKIMGIRHVIIDILNT